MNSTRSSVWSTYLMGVSMLVGGLAMAVVTSRGFTVEVLRDATHREVTLATHSLLGTSVRTFETREVQGLRQAKGRSGFFYLDTNNEIVEVCQRPRLVGCLDNQIAAFNEALRSKQPARAAVSFGGDWLEFGLFAFTAFMGFAFIMMGREVARRPAEPAEQGFA